jgi:hypothetical protein
LPSLQTAFTSDIARLARRWEKCKERCEAAQQAWESQIYSDLAAALMEHALVALPAVCKRNAAALQAAQQENQRATASFSSQAVALPNTVAALIIEPLASIICERSQPESAERSQVLAPQMRAPSGSIIGDNMVLTNPSFAHELRHYLHNSGVPGPGKPDTVALLNMKPLGSRMVVGNSKEVSIVLRSFPHRLKQQVVQ